MRQIELSPLNLCDPTRDVSGHRFTCADKADGKATFPCTGRMEVKGCVIPCWCACHGGPPPPPKPAPKPAPTDHNDCDSSLELVIDERDRAVRERDLLRPVAYRAQALLAALDDWEAAHMLFVRTHDAIARTIRKNLREALEAWGEDEGREED